MEILHIVAGTPGPDNAVADYAWRLCCETRARGIASHVLCHPSGPHALFDPALLTPFDEKGDRGGLVIRESAENRIVIFHYNGFSFSRHGAPNAFVEGLRRHVHRIAPRLVTVFHELWVDFLPWRRTAWYQPRQRMCVRRLLEASELAICSTDWVETRLRWLAPGMPILKAPVFSNIGELDHLPLKQPGLGVLFGGTRHRIYRFLREQPRALDRLAIEHIVDIGPALPREIPPLQVPVEATGVLSGRLVSAWMAKASLGFIAYPTRHIAKSGSLAALAAHGVCCINIHPDAATADGLQEGVHFLGRRSLKEAVSAADARNVGSAAFRWYQDHSLPRHVDMLVKVIDAPAPANLTPLR